MKCVEEKGLTHREKGRSGGGRWRAVAGGGGGGGRWRIGAAPGISEGWEEVSR